MYAFTLPVAEKMSCLVPQFKCLPDSFSIQFKAHSRPSPLPSKRREPNYFRACCNLSTLAPPASSESTGINLEKLPLSSLEVHSNAAQVLDTKKFNVSYLQPHTHLIAGSRPWMEGETGATLPSEFVTSEDAVIAAAAAEVVALGRAAVKLAKDAAAMSLNHSSDSVNRIESRDLVTQSHETEPTIKELELLQAQVPGSIAVRSKRRSERQVRRMRAAEKAAVSVSKKPLFRMIRKHTPRRQRVAQDDFNKKISIYPDELRDFKELTGGSKLLTAKEEVEMAAGVQDLIKLTTLSEELEKRFGGPPTLAQWAAAAGTDQKTLLERLNYGNSCKDRMITSNMRLVMSIATKYFNKGMSLADLIQEGIKGLMRGVEKFNASKGFKFSTYAHWWIKQNIQKALANSSRLIRVPMHIVEAHHRLYAMRQTFEKEKGRPASKEELADATGLSMQRVETVIASAWCFRDVKLAFEELGEDKKIRRVDFMYDKRAEKPEDTYMRKLRIADVNNVVDTLNPRERQVIRWRFGLDDGQIKTLQDIGELMGVSRERVRQIETQALRKLQAKPRRKVLEQHLDDVLLARKHY